MKSYTFTLGDEEEKKFERAVFELNAERKHPLDKKDIFILLMMKFADGEIDIDG